MRHRTVVPDGILKALPTLQHRWRSGKLHIAGLEGVQWPHSSSLPLIAGLEVGGEAEDSEKNRTKSSSREEGGGGNNIWDEDYKKYWAMKREIGVGMTGYPYEKIFDRVLVDAKRITEIDIDEPFINWPHQVGLPIAWKCTMHN